MMTVIELLQRTKNNQQSTDDAMLLWLYNRWKSEEGQVLRQKLEQCDPQYSTSEEIYDYYKSVFIFIRDDAARNCADIASEKIFTNWFCEDGRVLERLLTLLGTFDEKTKTKADQYIEDLKFLQGVKREDNDSCGYEKCKNRRGLILWDCALGTVAEFLGDDGDYNAECVFDNFKIRVQSEIEGSGYKGVDFENVLDAYIAYSIYRGIPKVKAYKNHCGHALQKRNFASN